MKYLLLILISVNCFAGVAWFPLDKKEANTNYAEQEVCEKMEGQKCYDVGACPMTHCELVDEVDDIGAYTGNKTLVQSGSKRDAYEAEKLQKEAEKESSKANKKALKASSMLDIKAATTIKALREAMEKYIEATE